LSAPHSVHLKLDPEVFDFFKRKGKGHLTRMQDGLKACVREPVEYRQGYLPVTTLKVSQTTRQGI